MILVRLGNMRGFDTFLKQSNPVGGRKPFVIFDIFRSILQIPKSLGEIRLHEISNQILQLAVKCEGNLNLP